MNATTAIEIAVYGGVIPAIAALGVFLVISRMWSTEVARRYRAGAAFALAVFIGYIALPTTISLAPTQFWEWIPHLGVLAAFVAALTRANGVTRVERWTAFYLLAAIGAWLIVPKWPELVPAWPIQWATLAVGIVTLTALLLPLSQREPVRAFPWWLMLAAAFNCVLVMAEVSEQFGRLAALPAGALAGCGIAAFFARAPIDWRGIALPYSVVVGGYAFTGYVYPTTPVWPLLAVPLAPLGLWMCNIGPLRNWTGARAVALQAICVLAPLIIIAALLLARGSGAAADEW